MSLWIGWWRRLSNKSGSPGQAGLVGRRNKTLQAFCSAACLFVFGSTVEARIGDMPLCTLLNDKYEKKIGDKNGWELPYLFCQRMIIGVCQDVPGIDVELSVCLNAVRFLYKDDAVSCGIVIFSADRDELVIVVR